MRFAYADPPYPGQARRYVERAEVDHAQMIGRLVEEYPDGWALSTSSPALRDVLALCPRGVRIAAWVKPFAVFKPNNNPAYCWEPVIFMGGRRGDRARATVRDFHSENITLERGLVGVKPPGFNRWILSLLGYIGGDTLDDLFPGSGGMAEAISARRLWV